MRNTRTVRAMSSPAWSNDSKNVISLSTWDAARLYSPSASKSPGENYRQGDRIRALILDVRRTQKDPQIILSRSNPAFLVKLFEQEVPEIAEAVVRIMCAAREPGQRAKIGVRSSDADVDPVGACVGMKGSRVQAVVQELRGEKIDIIPWNDDAAHFVCNALQPAEISKVIIDQDTNTMEVIVADDQLSLAIGKKGQNVWLAAKLTGWKIDVRSESKEEKITGESFERLLAIDGMDEETATILFDNGYRNPEDIAKATLAELTSFMGITEEKGFNAPPWCPPLSRKPAGTGTGRGRTRRTESRPGRRARRRRRSGRG